MKKSFKYLFFKLKNNDLISNTAIYTLTKIINSAIPFFLLPFITHHLAPAEYGIVSMFTVLVSLTMPFVSVNTTGSLSKEYYNRETIDFSKYIWNATFISILGSVFISLIYFFLADLIVKLTSIPSYLLWVVVFYTFMNNFISIIMLIFRLEKKPLTYSIISIIMMLMNVGLSIVLILVFNFTYIARIIALVLPAIIFFIILFIYSAKKKWLKFSINKMYIKKLLFFGIPLIPHALSTMIINFSDRIFITEMVGVQETGIYTVGYQIGSIINIIATAFYLAFTPWLFEKLKEDSHKLKKKIVKITYIYFALITSAAIILGLLAPYFIYIFLDKAYDSSQVYVIWVALGYSFSGMYLMVAGYIFYSENTKILSLITLFISILNLVLNYFLILKFGAVGAAFSTTISYFVKFLLVWFFSAKLYKMPWMLKEE
jgi:O-antigen/teichoic acid export membrane protein